MSMDLLKHRLKIFLPAFVVILLAILIPLSLPYVFPDNKDEELDKTPAVKLIYSNGVILDEPGGQSWGNLGTYRQRFYGTDKEPDEIIEFFDIRLTALGYKLKSNIEDDKKTKSIFIRSYQNGPYQYGISLVKPPVRLPSGHTIIWSQKYVLVTNLSNEIESIK